MIDGTILTPISAAAYKHENATFYGAMELNIEGGNSIEWSFNALSEGLEAAEIVEDGSTLKHKGFRPASVQRLDDGNTVISGWKRILIVDDNGELIQTYTYPRFNDIHETKITDKNTILVASTGADEILEFNEDFELIWRWKMWEHVDDVPEGYYPSHFADESDDIRQLAFTPDYRFHLNHVQYIDDELVMASALNHGVFVINRETDEIEAEITDLDECHNPYPLEDGTIVVPESGKDRIVRVDGDGIVDVLFEEGLSFVKDADKIRDDVWIIADTKNSRILGWDENDDDPGVVINLPARSLPYEVDYLTGGKTNA